MRKSYYRIFETGPDRKSIKDLIEHFADVQDDFLKMGKFEKVIRSMGSVIKELDEHAKDDTLDSRDAMELIEALHEKAKKISKFKYIADDIDKFVEKTLQLKKDKF